jgi:hypothetical protein
MAKIVYDGIPSEFMLNSSYTSEFAQRFSDDNYNTYKKDIQTNYTDYYGTKKFCENWLKKTEVLVDGARLIDNYEKNQNDELAIKYFKIAIGYFFKELKFSVGEAKSVLKKAKKSGGNLEYDSDLKFLEMVNVICFNPIQDNDSLPAYFYMMFKGKFFNENFGLLTLIKRDNESYTIRPRKYLSEKMKKEVINHGRMVRLYVYVAQCFCLLYQKFFVKNNPNMIILRPEECSGKEYLERGVVSKVITKNMWKFNEVNNFVGKIQKWNPDDNELDFQIELFRMMNPHLSTEQICQFLGRHSNDYTEYCKEFREREIMMQRHLAKHPDQHPDPHAFDHIPMTRVDNLPPPPSEQLNQRGGTRCFIQNNNRNNSDNPFSGLGRRLDS